MILVFLLYALFASVFTIAKTGLEFTQPFFFFGSRMLIAGICLMGYQKIVRKEKFIFNKKISFKLLQLGFLNIYLTNALEFWGLQYLSSFKTCFIYSLSPFLSALFCYFLYQEKLSLKKWLGLSLGILGVLPILISQSPSEGLGGQIFYFSWAELAVTGATISSVYGWILLKSLVSEHEISPMTANGVSMIIGGTLALVQSLWVENWDPIPVSNIPVYLQCAVGLIIISNFICYNLYGYLLKKYSASYMSVAGLTTSIFASFFGWIFLGEEITAPFIIGFPIVCLGLAIFDQEELQESYRLLKSNSVLISNPN